MQEAIAKLTIFGVSIFLMFFLSKYLVESLSHFAKKIRVSEFMVGSIVLAVGTSLPEIIDATVAGTLNLGELAVGIIIGSCIINLLLVLAFAVLTKPIGRVDKKVIKESYILLLVTAVFCIIISDGGISRIDGLILIATFCIYHWYLHKHDAHSGSMVYVREIQADIILTPIAIFTILLCGWIVINTGAAIATDIGIPMAFFGLVILALTTSLPELSSSIVSSKKGHSKMALGNVFGSNAADLLLAAGIAALVNPLNFAASKTIMISATIMLLITAAFTVYITAKKRISRKAGAVMLGAYMLYMLTTII